MWLLGFDLPGVGRIRIQKEALVEVEVGGKARRPVNVVDRLVFRWLLYIELTLAVLFLAG